VTGKRFDTLIREMGIGILKVRCIASKRPCLRLLPEQIPKGQHKNSPVRSAGKKGNTDPVLMGLSDFATLAEDSSRPVRRSHGGHLRFSCDGERDG
jgi:hypothetical protein